MTDLFWMNFENGLKYCLPNVCQSQFLNFSMGLPHTTHPILHLAPSTKLSSLFAFYVCHMYTNIPHSYCQLMKRSTIERIERLLTSFHKMGSPIGNNCLKITTNYKITATSQSDTSTRSIDYFPE